MMDQQKHDTTRPDGGQEKKKKRRGLTQLKKQKLNTKPAVRCPADGARTTQETQGTAETEGQNKNKANKTIIRKTKQKITKNKTNSNIG